MMAEQDRRILAEFTSKVCERFPDARIWAYERVLNMECREKRGCNVARLGYIVKIQSLT
ncbi:MAG: hypothetical protein ABIL06_01250 [Pseudomonadota bacterium]